MHEWEWAIKLLCDENADKMLATAQDIYNTAFIRGKNCVSLEQEPYEDCVKRKDVKSEMIKYGFLAPDMTVTEFVNSLPSVTPSYNSIKTELKPCEDCISREEALEEACEFYEIGYNGKGIFRRLKELPSVTPIRPYGHWITNSDYPDKLICSECNSKFDMWWIDKGSNYCPNCGAKMEV